jgi:hypothetical protein
VHVFHERNSAAHVCEREGRPERRPLARAEYGRGSTLAACGQADIDQWLHTGPSACLARDFLAWAASRGHCKRLTIPPAPHMTGPAISQDQRWAHAARLLHDTTIEPTDRVAGCLLLLYGQPLSRIAAMTTSQVTRRDGQTFIRLGPSDAPIPTSLADAALQLISNGRSYCGVGSPPTTIWLFPATCPDAQSLPPGSANACGPSASTPRPHAAPPCSTWPPNSPPRSSQTCSACTRPPPQSGCTKPEATRPATRPS